MRYEFERGGRTVANVLWEGPGQVTVDVTDAADRPQFDRFFGEEVAYLDAGFDFGGGMDEAGMTTRRRDWTPGSSNGRPGTWRTGWAARSAACRPAGRGTGRASGGGRGPMKVTGAQALFRSLEGEGVDLAFGIPGGAILPAYDPLIDSKVRHVLCRHEQGAGHAAEGYAWATGKVGVAIATSGPGGCNLVTALADAKMDSVPMVAITGQVPTPVVGNDAFQEADITGITMPITKHNFLVKDANELPVTIREAFHIARTGRPGPVLVDIPKDVQLQEFTWSWPGSSTCPAIDRPPRATSSRCVRPPR